MQDQHYALKTILASVFKEKDHRLKKRLIYNNAVFGGLSNKWIILLFIVLPFAMYAAIFNPTTFKELGIAQAIVFYIILLVVAMQIVAIGTYFNNKKVVKTATMSWEKYFPTVDFKMILSSGVTPYVDFKKHYELALKDGLEGESLKKRLDDAFEQMEEENSILVESIKRDKKMKEGE
jgi:magnesium-transporting ATPase (P-type)